jgi:hypothetical protein
MNIEQENRLTREWLDIAKDQPVHVKRINDTIYGFTTELGALRLFHKYSNPRKARAEYSENLKTWYFALDLN